MKEKLQNVSARVENACKMAGREGSEVTVLAVSKRHSAGRIRSLNALGQRSFGENYVQEALAKQAELSDLDLEWHFIGPVQSNKTRDIACHFQWVQSVDRMKVLRRLSGQRPDSLPSLNICIQVNIDREDQKSGVLPEALPELASFAESLPNVSLRGIMSIPRMAGGNHDPIDSFRRMHQLFRSLIESGLELDTLSMGMSADLEMAIAAGSTMVRVGTDLLGPRPGTEEEVAKK